MSPLILDHRSVARLEEGETKSRDPQQQSAEVHDWFRPVVGGLEGYVILFVASIDGNTELISDIKEKIQQNNEVLDDKDIAYQKLNDDLKEA